MDGAHIHYSESRIDIDVERIFIGSKSRNEVLAELFRQQMGRSPGGNPLETKT